MNTYKNLLIRSIREGSLQLWRNRFLSFTTIGLGTLILFLLNFVFGIKYFVDLTLQNIESRTDFSVPLAQDYDSFEFNALKNEIQMYSVETKILPAENFQDFELSPRLNIKFQNLNEVDDVLNIFKKARYTEIVGDWDNESERSFAAIIDKLLKLKESTQSAANLLTLLFIGGGILLAINTFRIVLFSRKDEVFIARLVGADNLFILGPFLFEGLLLGFISAISAIIVFTVALREITVLPGGEIFIHLFQNVFAPQVLLSGLVGIIGAVIAVRKYLLGRLD